MFVVRINGSVVAADVCNFVTVVVVAAGFVFVAVCGVVVATWVGRVVARTVEEHLLVLRSLVFITTFVHLAVVRVHEH